MISAVAAAFVVGTLAFECSPGDRECRNIDPEVVDDSALLSLRIGHRHRAKSAGVMYWGNATVIAFSDDDGYTDESGWYGDSVAFVNSLKMMGFATGGMYPQQFYMRPQPGTDASGCIQFGRQVVIAKSSSDGDESACGWYGCSVAGVLDDGLSFLIGGSDPQAFYFLSVSGQTGCINYGDQVLMAETSDYVEGETNVLFKDGDVMAWGTQSTDTSFFLRPPAAGPGTVDICDNLNHTMAVVVDQFMEQLDEKLVEICANSTPTDETKYVWNIDEYGPVFGIHWKNQLGREVQYDVFTNISAQEDFTTSECVSDGDRSTFAAQGEIQLTWIEPATGSLRLFYQGFLPFISLDKEVQLELSDMKVSMHVDGEFITSSGDTSEVCVSSATVSACSFTADIKVTGAPNVQATIEEKIQALFSETATKMCTQFENGADSIVGKCLSIS